MSTFTGYLVSLDVGSDGLGTSDQIDSALGGQSVFTHHDMPLGTGTVNFNGTYVTGTFFSQSGQAYFVPEDSTYDPGGSLGYIDSFSEAIQGTTASETIYGTADGEVIHDTDDNIYWNTGSDRIWAGDGDDTIVFGTGNDTIYGEGGDDQIGLWTTGEGDNLLDGGGGNDTIIGGWGNDQIVGGSGNDVLTGAAGFDTINAGDGYDEIWVTDDHDYALIYGGEGAEDWDVVGFSNWVSSGGVDVTFTGNEAGTFQFQGTSTYGSFTEIEHVVGTDYADTIDGSASTSYQTIEAGGGDDSILGGSGDNFIDGGDGYDTINAGSGDNTIHGGDGNDDIYIDHADAVDQWGNPTTHTQNIDGGGWWDELYFDAGASSDGINITYTGNHAGTIDFGGVDGTFTSIEMINATQNNDVIDATATTEGEFASLLDGDDVFLGGSGDDAVWAGDGNDTLDGGAGNDELDGDEGNDSVKGGAGDDTLTGGSGSDTLFGGTGNDTFKVHLTDHKTDAHGEDGLDTLVIDEEGSNAGATVTYQGDTFGQYTIGDSHGDFSSMEVIQTTDNADVIDGSASNWGAIWNTMDGDDTITGTGGSDQVWSGDGNDSITAGTGNDYIDAGAGDDFVSGGIGDDDLYGKAGADTIDGGAGSDLVDGGSGNDSLGGGAGNDFLIGGVGDDTFAMADGDGFDTISDFTFAGSEFDQLDVSALTNADNEPVGVNDVVVSDDGSGNAVLTFPNGEGINLWGVDPATLDKPMLVAMGIPCFTQGVRITTPRGEVAIEHLRVGDLVQTLDHGPQPIRWIGKRHLSHSDLIAFPNLRPVHIRQGALGNARDMLVSPQHGMVTTQDSDTPTLARAIHLARNGGPGFRVAQGVRDVTYYHLMFERHEIILAEGAPTESFYPGPMALGSLCTEEQREIAHLFPELLTSPGVTAYGPTARTFIKRRELSRHTAAIFEPAKALA